MEIYQVNIENEGKLSCSDIHEFSDSLSTDVHEAHSNWADFSGSFSENKAKVESGADWASISTDPLATKQQTVVADTVGNTPRNIMLSTSSDEFGDFDWQGPTPVDENSKSTDILVKWKELSSKMFGTSHDSDHTEELEANYVFESLSRSVTESKLWNEVSADIFNPRPELWSHPSVNEGYYTAMGNICKRMNGGSETSKRLGPEPSGTGHRCQSPGRVSVSSSEDFEWNTEDSGAFLLNLKQLSTGSLSPETATLIGYLRSNVVSPVEVEMDIARATEGLSVLNEVELELMVEEMQTKFSRLAETLVSELEEREKLIAARGIRNKFIASGHQLVQHKESASPGKMGNLSVKELKKWATHSSRRTPEEKSPQKYIHAVIPYTPRSTGTSWDLETLEKLTRIVNAILNNLDVVPALLREYITDYMDIEDSGTYS